MKVHAFKADGRVFGFSQEPAGSNLPSGYGDWTAFKTLELERGTAQPGVDVGECLDDIDKFGFHLTDAHVRITDKAV